MKYNVISNYDETNNRNYYAYYLASEDDRGNLTCDDLPPYQDINKAKSCYWDGEEWVFDEKKYDEIIKEIEEAKKAAQEEADRLASIPTNEELQELVMTNMEAIDEIMQYIEGVVKPLAKLAALLKE